MTGTGTQADPYIPATLTEFITAVGTSGAYVALETDIDAADDPGYGGELDSTIAISCKQLDGGGHTLRGVTVRAKRFLSQSLGTTVQDLSILDCAHKKGDANYASLAGSSANSHLNFSGCKIALKIDASGGYTDAFEYCDFSDCAILLEYTGTSRRGYGVFDNSNCERCTVQIRNIYCTEYFVLDHKSSMIRSAYIIDGLQMPYNAYKTYYATVLSSQTGGSYTKSYSYVAFLGYQGTEIRCNYSATAGCLIATDDDSIPVTLSSNWTQCSIDQLKDEAYLSSIGWLP